MIVMPSYRRKSPPMFPYMLLMACTLWWMNFLAPRQNALIVNLDEYRRARRR